MKISKLALLDYSLYIQYQLKNHPILKSGKINIPSTFGEASLSVNTVTHKGINVLKTYCFIPEKRICITVKLFLPGFNVAQSI